jgi:hypothetical protein
MLNLRIGLVVAAVASSSLHAQTAATNGWPTSTAEAEGLKPAPLQQLRDRAKGGAFGNLDRLVVVKNGKLVMHERFDNDYRTISKGKTSPIGCGFESCKDSTEVHAFNYLHPSYHPWWQGREVHTLQSVTKSVSATLIGVALKRGEIADVKRPLLSFFDRYDVARVDPRLQKATLADLLTMRAGIEWHENDRPLDETNTTLQLERSRDWIRFTLAQPMDAEPGTKWVYNSGGSALMAEIIRRVSGEHIDSYAQKHLFGPLGIKDFHWKRTPTGHPDTEGGLYLNSLDLAKIGQLYLDDGVWNGTRILAPGWAKEATARHVDRTNPSATASPGYGYQWWRYDRRGAEVWAGNGFGGQFLIVIPSQRIVAVANSWNVFGAPATGILGPLIDALLDASGV